MEVYLTNAGRTPATGTTAQICSAVLEVGVQPGNYVDCHEKYFSVVEPTEKKHLIQVQRCEREVYQRLKSGQAVCWFYGKLSYQDVFGYPRTTSWRFSLDLLKGVVIDSLGDKLE